jgi:hypothetical protein
VGRKQSFGAAIHPVGDILLRHARRRAGAGKAGD